MSDHYHALITASVESDAAHGWDWLSIVERAKAGLLACGLYGSALIEAVNFAQAEASRVLPQRAESHEREEVEVVS